MIQPAKTILVDARTIDHYLPILRKNCELNQSLISFDIETSQRQAHDGIKALMKMDDDFYTKGDKVLFDYRRTIITGCSFYFGMSDGLNCYYLNFDHVDKENTIPISIMFELLDLIKASDSKLIIHNRQYEYITIKGSYGYTIPDGYCSMQLCVTAYNPDTYPKHKLQDALIKALTKNIGEIEKVFAHVDSKLNFQQEELVRKFCSKSKGSEFSYEGGIVRSIAYAYGLKQAVKSWFNYQMVEFKDTLGSEPDMSAITGEQVVDYGCDDAFWCYHLFLHIWSWLQTNNPNVIQTYLDTENPILDVLAETTLGGLKVNINEIKRVRAEKRGEMATALIEMKKVLREVMPPPVPEMNQKLKKFDGKWYTENSHYKYFNLVTKWLNTPDNVSAFDICTQVKCATGNAWLEEDFGLKPNALLSINHYMAMRYILFVLCGIDFTVSRGKVQSDGDARDKMGDHPILKVYKTLGDIEQGMKLYNTPYIHLTDPETSRMYPQLSSLLATRRMSCQNPNGMQLSKRGASAYVRGYYEADTPDHLIVSADWSAIEMLRVAAASQDPEFLKAYSQRPHLDLHTKAAAGVLDMSVEELKDHPNYKVYRTELGKGSNFNYWYSGALNTIGERMGWSSERMWEAVEGYRNTFPVGEKWRIDLINQTARTGKLQLPDHHIRYRFECTDEWSRLMMDVFASFGSPAMLNFGRTVIRKLRNRAGNQAVNANVQGTCAALMKRTILKCIKGIQEKGFDARFMLPIHDELVFSVHKSQVASFCDFLYAEMIEDSDLFPNVKLDSSIAVGYTFQPFNPKDAKFGQIELHEINKGLACISPDRYNERANSEERDIIINYLVNRQG